MAQIDKLIAMMAQRNAERAVLMSDKPVRLVYADQSISGAIIPAGRLEGILQEIVPAHLSYRLTQIGRFEFPYQLDQGVYTLSVSRSDAGLMATLAAASAVPAGVTDPTLLAPSAPPDWNQPNWSQPNSPPWNQQAPVAAPSSAFSNAGMQLNAFGVLGQAWNLFGQNTIAWLGAALLYILVNLICGPILGVVITVVSRIPLGALFGLVLSTTVTYLLAGGLFRMAIRQLRGEPNGAGDLFSAFDMAAPLLGLAALTVTTFIFMAILLFMVLLMLNLSGLPQSISFLTVWGLFIIPGLLVAGQLMFTLPLIVDQQVGSWEAIRRSWTTLVGRGWKAAWFFFLVSLAMGSLPLILNLAGWALHSASGSQELWFICFFLSIVSQVFTLPLWFLSISIAYQENMMDAGAL